VSRSTQSTTHASTSLGTSGGRPPAGRGLALIAVLLAAAVAVQVVRDRGWTPYEPQSSVLWIRSGEVAKRLALGFDNLVADAYWVRAVINYGGQLRKEEQRRDYSLLYPLLDLVTTLDPRFRVAYRFGAIFLTEGYPAGPGRPDLAVRLLEKGIEHDPGRWEYYHDIGFVYYWTLRDYEKAAEWFARAGDIPGAASWLAPLAAVTLAEGGNRASSRRLWTELHDTTEAEWIRTNALRRLQQLDVMDAIDELNRNSQSFMVRRGRPPANWRELAADQRWRALPSDPTGTAYLLDPETGRVSLSRTSSLWPLPEGAPVRLRP
jgi:tetratricopeptide (TPR) repeat protein